MKALRFSLRRRLQVDEKTYGMDMNNKKGKVANQVTCVVVFWRK